ncbi:hypothetical protein P7H20_26685 [Paenibacillus larvae]|nr:hypothetical protein [Paenibacillus larvae]MDT2277715.1 hypothetical protein [Paenibacillus larvae]
MLTSIDIHAWLDTFLAAASLFVAFRTLQVTKKPKKNALNVLEHVQSVGTSQTNLRYRGIPWYLPLPTLYSILLILRRRNTSMEEFSRWAFTVLLMINLIVQILIYRQVKDRGKN